MKVLQFAKLASVAATLLLLAACDGTQFTVAPAVVVDPVAGDGGEDAGFSPGEAGHPDAIDHDAGPWPEEAGTKPDAGSQVLEAAVDAGADSALDAAHDADADAQADSADASTVCADDLSSVHAGDFHVDFDVLGVAAEGPLLEQRSVCGQYEVQWVVAETSAGNVDTYFYDGSGGFQLQSVATVNDGVWHHVVVARVALTFSITIDGQLDNSVPNAVWSPPTLSLLQVGRSACSAAFAGQIKNVCVTRQ